MEKLEPMRRDYLLLVGRALSTLVVLFLLFDAFGKLTMPKPVMESFLRLELSTRSSGLLAALLLGGTLLYALPLTSVLGAVVLTGYLGGAVAIHVRAGSSLFETVFPVLFGTMIWAGLLMRERRLLQFFPLRRG
ncbi:MAG TPA: DoxX family protein [Terracidiphilus sp.]|nr:DoxX family protein [Terracidiphilus sp.]